MAGAGRSVWEVAKALGCSPNTHVSASGGVGFGSIVAGLLSWAQWKSIGWALVHAFCGWLYIIAWAMSCTESAPLVFP